LKEQIHIFDDVSWVCCSLEETTSLKSYGPFYCAQKANEKLITLLRKGICAWLTHDFRKAEFWKLEKS